MASGRRHDHHDYLGQYSNFGSEVDIAIRGEYIPISSDTLSQHLPNLEWYTRSHGNISRNGHLIIRPGDDFSFHDSISQRALQCLFRYLQEIDLISTSSALYDYLEKSWRQSIQGRGWYGRLSPTTRLFATLGKILDPMHYGSSKSMFDAMSTFFSDHCEEIMADGGDDLIEYLYALDRMDRNMTHVLSLVSQKGRLTERDLHKFMYPTRDLEHQLYPDTIGKLEALIGMKHERAYLDHAHDHHTIPRRRRRGGRWSGRHVGHRGGEIHSSRTKTGAEVGADYLLHVHDYDPESILIRGRSRRNRHYPYDDIDDHEDMYFSDEEYVHGDGGYFDHFRDRFNEGLSSDEDNFGLMHEFSRARMPLGHHRRAIERNYHEDDFDRVFQPRGRVVERNLLAGVY